MDLEVALVKGVVVAAVVVQEQVLEVAMVDYMVADQDLPELLEEAQFVSFGQVAVVHFHPLVRGIYKCLTSLEFGQPRNNSKRVVKQYGPSRQTHRQSVQLRQAATFVLP